MNTNPIIKDKEEFISTAEHFLDSIFSPGLEEFVISGVVFFFSKNSG